MAVELLTIGKLASLAAVTPDTLRYYERLGLWPAPPRTNGGYRLYDPSLVERIGFIRKAQALSLSLEDVREILRVADKGTPPCEHVRTTLAERLRDVDARIAELQTLRQTLSRALARSRSLPLAKSCVCSIIEAQSPSAQAVRRTARKRLGRTT
jgi:DNA-binding transcriptional MerR regulator